MCAHACKVQNVNWRILSPSSTCSQRRSEVGALPPCARMAAELYSSPHPCGGEACSLSCPVSSRSDSACNGTCEAHGAESLFALAYGVRYEPPAQPEPNVFCVYPMGWIFPRPAPSMCNMRCAEKSPGWGIHDCDEYRSIA